MAEFILSAFADEAGSSPEEQIEALLANGIRYIEPRSFWKKGILKLTDDELLCVKKMLDEAGIKVNSLGSPIGKYPINEPLETHLKEFGRAIEICKILETDNMRIFSFFIPKGEDPRNYSDEVNRRMQILSEISKTHKITLNHENEKDIFGQNPDEVVFLADNLPDVKFIFDGANYRECDCDTIAGINATLKNFGYLHIKDAIHSPHSIVPAGEGEARLDEIFNIVDNHIDGKVFLTLEPHLKVFDAFKEIDNTELHGKYTFRTNREAFDFAARALKILLTKEGYKEVDGIWKK